MGLMEQGPFVLLSYFFGLASVGSNVDAVVRARTQYTQRAAPRRTTPAEASHEIRISRETIGGAGCQGSDVTLPNCFAYGAGRRLGPAARSDGSWEDSTIGLFSDRAALRNAEDWLLRLDHAASKRSKIQEREKKRREQVLQMLIGILPEVSDIRFAELTKEAPKPSVEFKTPDGWIPLLWIGYGYRTVMAWMVDFASRMVDLHPDSRDPLAEPAVVLVDEIDLHLHPSWQRTLMGYLSDRFPNTQFIATAHSPLFVQAADGANIVVLRREKDHVVIDNDVKAVEGWRVDQVLTSDLFGLPTARGPKQEELLAERKKLLTKPKLTKKDRERVKELEDQIGSLPGGETAESARTLERIEQTLRKLEKKRSGPGDSDQ